MKRSRRRAMKMNCNTFTEHNSSSSKSRSFLSAHTETAIERREMKIKGMKASVQKWRPDSSLSATSNSNINKSNCNETLINMDLKWVYEDSDKRYSGLKIHTNTPTKAPSTTNAFHAHKGINTSHQEIRMVSSRRRANKLKKASNEVNTTNLLLRKKLTHQNRV